MESLDNYFTKNLYTFQSYIRFSILPIYVFHSALYRTGTLPKLYPLVVFLAIINTAVSCILYKVDRENMSIHKLSFYLAINLLVVGITLSQIGVIPFL